MPKTLFTACLFLLAVSVLMFLVWPKYQELGKRRLEEREKEIQWQKRQDYFSNLRELSRKLENYKESLEKIETIIPKDPEIPRLLNFLAQAAENNGLLLNEIGSLTTAASRVTKQEVSEKGQEQSEQRKSLRETVLSIKLLGDYPSFENFLTLLEKSARLIETEAISFSSATKTGFFSFALRIKVHSY